jgi:hypothetical protein
MHLPTSISALFGELSSFSVLSWTDEDARRRAIIRTAAPIILDAGISVTPNMIHQFMEETAELSPRATGQKLFHLVDAVLLERALFDQ